MKVLEQKLEAEKDKVFTSLFPEAPLPSTEREPKVTMCLCTSLLSPLSSLLSPLLLQPSSPPLSSPLSSLLSLLTSPSLLSPLLSYPLALSGGGPSTAQQLLAAVHAGASDEEEHARGAEGWRRTPMTLCRLRDWRCNCTICGGGTRSEGVERKRCVSRKGGRGGAGVTVEVKDKTMWEEVVVLHLASRDLRKRRSEQEVEEGEGREMRGRRGGGARWGRGGKEGLGLTWSMATAAPWLYDTMLLVMLNLAPSLSTRMP
eukprot:768714-Hanusia_phi.AAC.9